MPLHTPDGGVTDPEWKDLDRKLREGDGVLWPGDPRLWLGIGVVEDKKNRRTGRRLEVWRDNEDGTTTLVSHWHPSEQFRVLYDLGGMRAEAPGHVDAITKIDAANDALLAAQSTKAQEDMYETLEHALKLDHDRNNPRNKFFMNDIKEPEPQATPAPATEAA